MSTSRIVARINAETVRLDISAWYLTEHAISIAIANRFAAGPPVRLIGDRGAIFEIDPHTKTEFYWLASQGVPRAADLIWGQAPISTTASSRRSTTSHRRSAWSSTWNAATFAVSYDVYVGTSPSALVLAGDTPAQLVNDPPATYSWTPSSPLQGGTTYCHHRRRQPRRRALPRAVRRFPRCLDERRTSTEMAAPTRRCSGSRRAVRRRTGGFL